MDAHLVKGILEENGIKCLLQKEGLYYLSDRDLGADLFVNEKDLSKAMELLTNFLNGES